MQDPEQQPVILSAVAARFLLRPVLWDTPPRLAPRPARFAANFTAPDQQQQLVILSEAKDLSGQDESPYNGNHK
jgi:hypothetical protein